MFQNDCISKIHHFSNIKYYDGNICIKNVQLFAKLRISLVATIQILNVFHSICILFNVRLFSTCDTVKRIVEQPKAAESSHGESYEEHWKPLI